MTGNVAMFMDAENIIRSFRDACNYIQGAFIDFHDLRTYLADGRKVSISKAYSSYSPTYGISSCLKNIELDGFDLELEKITGRHQKGVDARMTIGINIASIESDCDTVIIISGDGDFAPAARMAKKRGKHIEVAAYKNSISKELAEEADEIILLDDLDIIDTRKIRRVLINRKYFDLSNVSDNGIIGSW